jgi:hypothetical protein
MGQKTHPLGFRLGTTQAHKSTWYSNFNQYAKILKEDDTIRTYIKTISKAKSIANVRINRNGLNDQIQLNIETGKPGILVGDLGIGLETLLSNIKKLLPANRQLTINVFEVEKVSFKFNPAIKNSFGSMQPTPEVICFFGSRSITELPGNLIQEIMEALRAYMEDGYTFIVGDAPGIDISILKALDAIGAKDVVIYHAGTKPRVNIGKQANTWTFYSVPGDYTERDTVMIDHCDCAYAINDFSNGIGTPGSNRNIEQLINTRKSFTHIKYNKSGTFDVDVINPQQQKEQQK